MTGRVAVEIAVQDPAGVRAAVAGGADRAELCTGLETGGLTPSAGLIAAAAEAGRQLPDGVHVLIRPRAGGFCYTAEEIDIMVRDVRVAADAGASGVVVGALSPEGDIDVAATCRLMRAAGELPVTFHRAFDVVPEPLIALQRLAGIGIARVLTSGQMKRSIAGLALLKQLVAATQGGVEVMAGGGVRVQDIRALCGAGVDAVHLSARTSAYAGPAGPGGGEARYDMTSVERVREAVAAAAEPLTSPRPEERTC